MNFAEADNFFSEEGKKKHDGDRVLMKLSFQMKNQDKYINNQLVNLAISQSLKSMYGELGSAKYSITVKDIITNKNEAIIIVEYNQAREVWASIISLSKIQDTDLRIKVISISLLKEYCYH